MGNEVLTWIPNQQGTLVFEVGLTVSTKWIAQLHEVSFNYPDNTDAGLHQIDLCVQPGEHLVLLGASGSGKSTLLRLVAQLLRPSVGTIHTYGRVALVQQDPASQIIGATVWEDVCFGPSNLGLSPQQVSQRVSQALQVTGTDTLAHYAPGRLSTGQLQRVALAGALAMEPALLLLDEPTAYLDPTQAHLLMILMQKLCTRGVAVVEATHSLSACRYADRVALLDHGRIVRVGKPESVLADRSLLQTAGILPSYRLNRSVKTPTCRDTGRVIAHLALHGTTTPLPLRAAGCLAISGATGSGKTSLVMSLLGLDASGLPLRGQSYQARIPSNVKTAVLFQQPERFFWGATVDEEMWGTTSGTVDALNDDQKHGRVLFEQLGLDPDLHTRTLITLSEGEQRRVALATALARSPHVLIADHPFAGLDLPTKMKVEAVLHTFIMEGGCLILVTNERKYLRSLADTSLVLIEGRIAFCGPTDQLLRDPSLLEAASLLPGEWSDVQ